MAVVLGIALLIAIAVLVKLVLAPGNRTETRQPQAKQPPVAPVPAIPAALSMPGGDMVLVPGRVVSVRRTQGAATFARLLYRQDRGHQCRLRRRFVRIQGAHLPESFPDG